MSLTKSRDRGVVLTPSGKARLEAAIIEAQQQEKDGKRFTLEEIAERTANCGASLSQPTIRKVRQGKKTALPSVNALFKAFGLELNTSDYGLPEAELSTKPPVETTAITAPQRQPRIDLLEAPDASIFYGREAEQLLLRQWVLADRCRLIALLGMGGMGKTALSVRLVEAVQGEFDYVIWRSLREAPPVETVLEYVIRFLSDHQELHLPAPLGEAVTRLVHYLAQARCLLVLDNAESILAGGTRAGQYREGYEGYGTLIQRLGESRHQSCVVLTSREKPGEVARLEGRNRPVRSYSLQGLEAFAGQELLKAEGLDEHDAQWEQVFDYYSGNPLALKIATSTIQDLFGGNTHQFLAQGAGVFGDIRDLLTQQFERLTDLGQSVMYWLVINREATSIEELQTDLLEPISPQDLLEVLQSLQRRSLVERSAEGFTLQNVVMEYLTDRLIVRVSEEIASQRFNQFHTHALIKATAKDYVRETQVRLILEPVSAKMAPFQQQVRDSLESIRQCINWIKGYAPGNLLNLLCQSQSDRLSFDFSHLTLRQAYLSGMQLHSYNLTQTHWIQPALTYPFNQVWSVAFSPDGTWLAMASGDATVRLWQVSTGECRYTLTGHTNWVWSVAFSPDGTWLATASEDATVRLWQVSTGECRYTLTGHTNWVWSVAFSPDGTWLATASGDATVRLWQVSTGECRYTLAGHAKSVRSIAFSPDGTWLATGSDDATVRLWQVETGECRYTLTGHTNWVWSVAFSPDGTWLATASGDATVRLWQVSMGECRYTLIGHAKSVKSVAFSPEGTWLATGSDDATVRLWQVSKGECRYTLTGHAKSVSAVAFSPDGTWLATASGDATVRLWQVSKGECRYTLTGHAKSLRSVAFSPEGTWLATASGDATVRLWQVSTGECRYTLTGYAKSVSFVAFSPDGTWLATGSEDTPVRLWQVSTGECRYTLTGHTNWVWSVAFSPDGTWLTTASGDATVRLWQVSTGECRYTLTDHAKSVSAVAFSPDGTWLATASDDATVRLWQVDTGECRYTLTDHAKSVKSVAFSPDGTWLATASDDATVRLWQVDTGECRYTLTGHAKPVSAAAFSPDSTWLATASRDATVRLWQVSTGECRYTLTGHAKSVSAIAFSPDGTWLATASEDATVRLWQVDTGECHYTLTSHTNWVWSVAFSPDGTWLATASGDATVRLWQVNTGECRYTLTGHTNWVWSVAFSLDGTWLATASEDATARLWQANTGECCKVLQIPRPYEGTDITGAKGLTEAQRTSMLALGAVDHASSSLRQLPAQNLLNG